MTTKQIDLFGDSPNFRWDQDKNAKLLNIIFHGGTFGNFLKFFLDKFSKHTPDIKDTPFNDIGTSHTIKKKLYSGLIQRYHLSFINDNKNEINLPICLILPNTSFDFLYLKSAQWFRAKDSKILPDHLWQKSVEELKNSEIKESVEDIFFQYKSLINNDYIPKFIVRDWYKLEFLEDITNTFNFCWFEEFKNHRFFLKQKIYHFPLESFFNFDIFIKNLKLLDLFFNLQLDFSRLVEMKSIFDEPFNLDICRIQNNLVLKIINNLSTDENMLIPDLDVSNEAFIYAYIEKTYPFVVAPLTNYFFKDTNEIRSFIKSYPEHYKAMNPNLPKFNGIDNPFYLWKIKNKQ